MAITAPGLATEVSAMVEAYPAIRFNQRERMLLLSVKTYVDSEVNESLPVSNVRIGNASGIGTPEPTAVGTSASKIRAIVNDGIVFTVTSASPAVFTSAAHGLLNGDAVVLSTTGALYTGLAAATTYFVVSKATNTFQLSATWGGASLNSSGSQSGVHSFSSSGLSVAPLSLGNADIAAAAIIDYSKLAALTSGNILVGSAGNVATSVTMSGDATIIASGALTIANSAVTGAKMAALNSGNILVGSAGNVATSVAMSGDATIIASGALTIAALAVTGAKMAANTVDYAQLANDVLAQTAVVSLTQSNITGLSVTPITLLAAPGAGKVIIVQNIEILHTYSTTVYANGGKLQVRYNTSNTSIAEFAVGVVTASASHNYWAFPSSDGIDNSTGSAPSALQTIDSFSNQAVELINATAPFINGNAGNILKFRLTYSVVTIMT